MTNRWSEPSGQDASPSTVQSGTVVDVRADMYIGGTERFPVGTMALSASTTQYTKVSLPSPLLSCRNFDLRSRVVINIENVCTIR